MTRAPVSQFLAKTVLTMAICMPATYAHAGLTLKFSDPLQNSGAAPPAAPYSFEVSITNTGSTDFTMASFNLPFDLAAGFSVNSYTPSAAFNNSSMPVNVPLYDVLFGGAATGTATGLQLQAGQTETLFTFSLDSDGTSAGDVVAATLIQSGMGAVFGQFAPKTDGFRFSDLEVSGAGATLTAVPEPSPILLLGGVLCGFAMKRYRLRRLAKRQHLCVVRRAGMKAS